MMHHTEQPKADGNDMLIPKESIKMKKQIRSTYIPAGHVSHWLLPAWSWYFPEGHGMGSGLPEGQ